MKQLVFAFLSCFTIGAFGQNNPVSSNDPLEISFVTDFNQNVDLQQHRQDKSHWPSFVAQHADWSAYFNEKTFLPHRAFGPGISISGSTIQQKALNFIENHLVNFDVETQNLALISVRETGKHDYVNMQQTHEGLNVVSSRVVIKLIGSSVIMFGLDYFPNIELSTTPSINQDQAEQIASVAMTNALVSVVTQQSLKVLPITITGETSFHLVYEIVINTISETGIPANYQTFVDAHNGEILYRTNLVKHISKCPKNKDKKKVKTMGMVTVEGSVKAELYPTSLLEPTEILGLPHLAMTIDGNTVFTDGNGSFTTSLNSEVPATLGLQGSFVSVNTNGIVPSFNTTLIDGNNPVSFDGNANLKELSTYRAVNLIHDHMKSYLPDFDGLDFIMDANIDVAGECNAFYDGNINFYDIGGGCNATSLIADVVYHEYGHAINSRYYDDFGMQFNNGAMGEGYSDLWAISLSDNPHLGQGFFTDTDDGIRRYDIDPAVYPQDLVGEVHADGEIICGAWYDTHLLMGADWELTMSIFIEAYAGFQAVGFNGNEGEIFVDILLDALQADDDDGDITNGTPNDLAIIEGFAIHGINLLSAAEILHDELFAYADNEDIVIEAEIDLQFPINLYLDGARMYYKINTGLWIETELVNVDGNDYEAIIPGQAPGTVVAYYLGLLDNLGNLAAVIPSRANIEDPALPYFILVNVEIVAEHDSDSNEDFGVWETGVAGDDATAGVWELNIPIGSFTDPGNPATMVAPDHQHTAGIDGEFCFVTQQSPNENGSIYDTDVDDGFTTVRSPIIDLSEYDAPVLSYWRWFAHSPTGNPVNIGWIVQVSDDGGNSWVDIESTTTDDKSWRRNAIRVEDYVEVNDQFRIQMIASDPIYVGAGSLVEAAVDDIYIWELDDGVSVAETVFQPEMFVYPNPASDMLTVELSPAVTGEARLKIIDAIGQMVWQSQELFVQGQQKVLSIPLGDLATGTYVLTVNIGNEKTMHQRVVIQR